MYLTRDNTKDFVIELWEDEEDFRRDDEYYLPRLRPSFAEIRSIAQFKKIFPDTKLPRKGSCKWVELRLFIP